MDKLFFSINIARLTQQIAKANPYLIKKLIPFNYVQILKQMKIQESIEHKLKKDSTLSKEILKLRKDNSWTNIENNYDYKNIFPNPSKSNPSKYAQFIFTVINVLE
jgi:hypothetical protein